MDLQLLNNLKSDSVSNVTYKNTSEKLPQYASYDLVIIDEDELDDNN